MRREAREERDVTIHQVEHYHHGTYEKRRVFASDRPNDATRDYRLVKDNSLPAMYGIELETEAFGITSSTTYANLLKQVCFQHFHNDLWKVESDISLRGADVAAECITQPMTRAFIRNNYRNFQAMYEMFSAFGIDNARTGDCGQHCHISATCFGRTPGTQNDAIRRFFFIVMRYFKTVCTMTCRNVSNTHYCQRAMPSLAYEMRLDDQFDHYCAVNLSHYSRGDIEFRVPGGQPDFESFRATLETVFQLVDAAKNLTREQCNDIRNVFRGCNQYVLDALRRANQAGYVSDEALADISADSVAVDW